MWFAKIEPVLFAFAKSVHRKETISDEFQVRHLIDEFIFLTKLTKIKFILKYTLKDFIVASVMP
jgi:hypothetical protein